MEQLDLQFVTIWTVAAISLALQIFLFVTWPKRQNGAATTMPSESYGSAAKQADAPQVWEAPSEAALDGILVATPSSEFNESRGSRKKKSNAAPSMQQRIVRAGIYRKGGMRVFHVVRFAATVSLLFSGCLIIPFTSWSWIHAIYIGALAGLAGYLLPSFWLDRQLKIRQIRMRRALPDALDLITVCLQGGLSLPASLSRVARELGPAHPMLATELSIVEREIQMGRSTGNAMFQFAQRFNMEELRSLSSVVGQTEKYGGTIAGALKTFAESLRSRRKQRAEEMAQKAAVKLLFPTLFCIFPGIFVVILGPTAVRMYQVMSGISWSG